jgi:hypothetical protein
VGAVDGIESPAEKTQRIQAVLPSQSRGRMMSYRRASGEPGAGVQS